MREALYVVAAIVATLCLMSQGGCAGQIQFQVAKHALWTIGGDQ